MPVYTKKKKIGEGTYATIFLATINQEPLNIKRRKEDKNNDDYKKDGNNISKVVAIKKMKKTKYSIGHDISVIREIKALKKIKGKYIINLLDVYIKNDDIHLVLDYMETDLECIINNKEIIFQQSDIKSWMWMILNGVYTLHKKFILHRDLKPNNILVSKSGLIKIADFGLSRQIGIKMTPQACTRWYRAPELLLGCRSYGMNVDMWSVGCIFAELMLRVPLFAGQSDLEQLNLIFKVFGTPSNYPSIKELPGYMDFTPRQGMELETLFTAASSSTLDLLRKFFIFDPNKRISCSDALNDKYFRTAPEMTRLCDMPFCNQRDKK